MDDVDTDATAFLFVPELEEVSPTDGTFDVNAGPVEDGDIPVLLGLRDVDEPAVEVLSSWSSPLAPVPLPDSSSPPVPVPEPLSSPELDSSDDDSDPDEPVPAPEVPCVCEPEDPEPVTEEAAPDAAPPVELDDGPAGDIVAEAAVDEEEAASPVSEPLSEPVSPVSSPDAPVSPPVEPPDSDKEGGAAEV